MKAHDTFCGSVCTSDPQKVSDLQSLRPSKKRPQPPPRRTRRRSSGHGAERAPPEKIGLEEASEGSPFQSSASFLAKIGAAGCRCLESSPPFERMGDEHTYPSFPKWLKSSPEKLSEKGD